MERNWKKYIEILRPVSCALGSLIVFLGFLFVLGPKNMGQYLQSPGKILKLLSAMVVYFLVVGSGNTINDVVDYEIDKINRPHRTIVRGDFTRLEATYYYIYQLLTILFLTVLGAANSPNPSLIPLIVIFFLAISFTYSFKIKATGLIANLTVAFAASMAFPFAALYVSEIRNLGQYPEIWLLYSVSFFILLIREIAKDMEDVEGDEIQHIQSIALKWGLEVAKWVINILIFCLTGILGFSIYLYQIDPIFITFVLITLFILGGVVWLLNKNPQEKKWRILASRLLLGAELTVILAYLIVQFRYP